VKATGDSTGRRIAVIGAVALLAVTAVGVRLVQACVFQHEKWTEEAERQQQRTVRLAPERGSLLDRQGRELAVSVPAWSAWADPSTLDGPAARADAAARLATVLPLSQRELARRLAQPRYFVWLARKLDRATRDRVSALGIPGVGFAKESRRVHPNGDLAATVLGAVGIDDQGLEGLEYHFDKDIAGRPGLLLTMRDARGGGFLPEGVSQQPPTRGADVVLTIDAVVQHVAERELRAAVSRTGAKAGSLVVVLPDTGEIAALTNLPTYDPNNLPTHPSHLRTNRAVASCYEPGSTLKIFTVAAALEAGVVRPDTVIDCGRGSIRIGRTRIRDHHSYDALTVREVLANSSNIGAIRIGRSVGERPLHDTLARFGFGRRTGVEFPTESPGILRDVADWSPLSLATISFGQEIAVTPLQLAAAAAAVANGGVLHPPRLVREVRRADGSVERPAPPASRRVISAQTARELSSMLESVVTEGTGRAAAVPGYRVAGKTGTAQVVGEDGAYADGRYVASFVGWAPAEAPAFVAVIVLDEPQGASYHGGTAAAPAFAGLARDVLRYLQVAPETPGHVIAAEGRAADAT